MQIFLFQKYILISRSKKCGHSSSPSFASPFFFMFVLAQVKVTSSFYDSVSIQGITFDFSFNLGNKLMFPDGSSGEGGYIISKFYS